jgi:ribonucleotide reductase beta subunit family protein with ferritin-like domain
VKLFTYFKVFSPLITKEMLEPEIERSFTESKVPMTVESMIRIEGIEVGVFKMIIESICRNEILQLNGLSPTILYDLERVH